jgi:hypothetical protein
MLQSRSDALRSKSELERTERTNWQRESRISGPPVNLQGVGASTYGGIGETLREGNLWGVSEPVGLADCEAEDLVGTRKSPA